MGNEWKVLFHQPICNIGLATVFEFANTDASVNVNTEARRMKSAKMFDTNYYDYLLPKLPD